VTVSPQREQRWARDSELAKYLGVSIMAIWRWQRDPDMKFPRPCRLGIKLEVTDLDEIDAWLRSRAVHLAPRRGADRGGAAPQQGDAA
jgi:predicted DNA-binding transcriptional regulator AlpA